MSEIFFKAESYRILSNCFNVHNHLGPGFLGQFIRRRYKLVFRKRIFHLFVKEIRSIKLKKWYKADFICFDQIIVELKSTPFIMQADQDQFKNYLKATALPFRFDYKFWFNYITV